jgi:hypothetical protein
MDQYEVTTHTIGGGIAAFGKSVDYEDLKAELIAIGSWEEVTNGFIIHDFLDYQLSRREVSHLRNIRAKAGRIGGLKRVENIKEISQEDNQANVKQNAKQTSSNIEASDIAKTKPITSTITIPLSKEKIEKEEAAPPLARKSKKAERQITDEDRPTDRNKEIAKRYQLDVEYEWSEFADYCISVGRPYADFEAAFNNSMRRSAKRKGTLKPEGKKGLPIQMTKVAL